MCEQPTVDRDIAIERALGAIEGVRDLLRRTDNTGDWLLADILEHACATLREQACGTGRLP